MAARRYHPLDTGSLVLIVFEYCICYVPGNIISRPILEEVELMVAHATFGISIIPRGELLKRW
jgi:hypothetical protein